MYERTCPASNVRENTSTDEGDFILVIGSLNGHIGGSEYLKTIHKRTEGPIANIDMRLEHRAQVMCLESIEKAILDSDIGLTPNNDGTIIRLSIPPLTEERRIELTKQVKTEEEQAKVSVRNIRRDSIQDLKDFLNEKMISEDDFHKGQNDIQQITDQMIENIESIGGEKQKELMTI